MKRFTLFAACGLLAATVSAQRPAGTFTADETVRSAFSPSMITKVDSNLAPSSYGGQGCDTLRLYTFSLQGGNPGGFIFGFNAFLDKQKGYMFNANGTVPGAGFAFGRKALLDSTSTGGSYVAHIYTESSPGMWSLAASSTPVSYANIDTAFGQNGPAITSFLFLPAVQVNGNFLVTVDVYSQADTASGVALWSNGPSCGSGLSYEVWEAMTGDTIVKISDQWNGSSGAPLLADPFMGILVQGFTGVETLTSNSLMAYPNPANNMVTVGFGAEKATQGTLEIMNLAGQVVLSQNIDVVSGKNTIEINIADLASGVYAYQVKTAAQQMTGKLVVNH